MKGERVFAFVRIFRARTSRLSANGLAVLAGLTVLPVYVIFSSYFLDPTGGAQSLDPLTNSLASKTLADTGSLDISEYRIELTYDTPGGQLRWFVETPDGALVPNSTPGVLLVGALSYRTIPESAETIILPAAFAAVVLTASSVGLLARAARRSGFSHAEAYGAALTIGLTTPFLAVLSDALWQHTVSIALLSIAINTTVSRRQLATGGWLGLALLSRPLVSVSAAILGIHQAIARRSLGPIVRIGVPTGIAAALLVTYNDFVFGSPSVTGSYGSYPITNLAGSDTFSYPSNLIEAFFSPYRGILVYTPMIALVLLGVPFTWRQMNLPHRTLLSAAIVYLLFQYRVSYFSGGSAFFSYRNSLEAIALLFLPGLAVYHSWIKRSPPRRHVFWVLAIFGFVLQVYGASRFSIVSESIWEIIRVQ